MHDESWLIFPPYEAFYIESLLTHTVSAMESMEIVSNWIDLMVADNVKALELPKPKLFDHLHNIALQAASVSRYLWPSKSGENSIHKKRALKLRQALEITDDSPLKNRKLRNQMEHFDERLDNYLAQDILGEFIPDYVDFEPLNVDHPVHVFKAFYINRREFVLLGETHKMQHLCKELLRVHELLEQFSRTGHRLG
ncbi:hypothetical protein [Vibrio fluvialis]|uniref:hypothetical protein n=1 Tax=Vibrio fluvialis TaxID=676 RepID=UPI00192C4542|nr:hypothetical protein [Vibrio fluvialis]MBL4286367.1 hypothetical protein [Vibrio fluvialis]MBL4292902.1 hypothetical protein [Vibrio fluvialis]